jgi:hypothetical protein
MIPSASLNISSKCFNPYTNFTEERLTLQSQLSTLIIFFEVQHLNYSISIKEESLFFEENQVSYLYIFNLCKNMCLLEIFELGDKFTGLQMKIGGIVCVF